MLPKKLPALTALLTGALFVGVFLVSSPAPLASGAGPAVPRECVEQETDPLSCPLCGGSIEHVKAVLRLVLRFQLEVITHLS